MLSSGCTAATVAVGVKMSICALRYICAWLAVRAGEDVLPKSTACWARPEAVAELTLCALMNWAVAGDVARLSEEDWVGVCEHTLLPEVLPCLLATRLACCTAARLWSCALLRCCCCKAAVCSMRCCCCAAYICCRYCAAVLGCLCRACWITCTVCRSGIPLYTEIWGAAGRPLPPPPLLLLLQLLLLLVPLVLLATPARLDVWGTGSSFSMAYGVAQSGRTGGRRAGGC